MTSKKAKLGEILLKHTSLTEKQLEDALLIQREKGGKLGDILIDKGYLSPEQIQKALSVQLGLPFYQEIPGDDIDPILIDKIPINYARENEVIPIVRETNRVVVAIANPLNQSVLDDLRIILKSPVQPVIASPIKIKDAINRVYEKKEQKSIAEIGEETMDLSYELEEPEDLLDASDEAPIIRLVNSLLFRAVKERASDIHIEPQEREVVVRYRIDGILYDVYKPPKAFQNSITSRIKVMADLNIAEKRLPQDGRIKIKIAGKDIDIRVSTVPISHGERIVLRLQDKSNVLLNLKDLGFDGEIYETLDQLIHKSYGIILVTGPTGSGKTATLYACLTRLNSVEINILTVEDPVEMQLKGVGQIPVNPKINLTFAAGLRAILRQDPDVVMVGEIRDLETAEISIQASLTGHLVLSTLHTNDAPGAITRLVDMGVEPFLVSSSILGVIGQRLVRKICKFCKEEYTPTPHELKELGLSLDQFQGKNVYSASQTGCEKCMKTGYAGRTSIKELFVVDDEIRQLILSGTDSSNLKKKAIQKGMKTIRDDGIAKVLAGVTTIEEILRATQVEI
ncbi:MAG: type II secretion system ATPase GspE [Deltaproteobacteria bacterium]|nr:type II secretion system ATPase GspE [Deltaproteobacteria bacterium]MBI3017952.1 type II secretion system ATPase GspE [Deltaproteobacteria bacterium]